MERCPECAKLGRDTQHDNLARYSDGHVFCFSCGYYTHGSKIQAFKHNNQGTRRDDSISQGISLPSDIDTNYPDRALRWIEQYSLTKNTLLSRHVVWSESRQRLIFPYYIKGELIGWQGRYFGKEPISKQNPKWFSQGKLHEVIYTIGEDRGTRSLVLVEDVISAIKLSRYKQTSPIFGSVIGTKHWSRLSKFYDDVTIWLDPDKRSASIKEAKIGSMFGIKTHVVFSNKDPKEHTNEEIMVYLYT